MDRIEEMMMKKNEEVEVVAAPSFESRLMESASVKWVLRRGLRGRRSTFTESPYHVESHDPMEPVEPMEPMEPVEPVDHEERRERPENAFKKTKYESPVKKSLLGQLRSVAVGDEGKGED